MALYSSNTASLVIGSLMKNTNLLTSGEYKFRKKGKDFEQKFHNVIFRTIHNLAGKGCKIVTPIEICEFLEAYPSKLEIFEDSNGMRFCEEVAELANEETFEYYHTKLRKYSMLRMMQNEMGIDISEIYDETKNDAEQEAQLESLSIDEIIDFFNMKINEVQNEFSTQNKSMSEKKAGDNAYDILERFKDKEFYGACFDSGFITSLWGSFRKGQVYMRSSDTSGGKSRHIVGDLGRVGLKRLYNLETKEWEDNPSYADTSVLYIGTEMDMDEEVEPLFWAYATGIESSKITKGLTTSAEDDIIKEAIDMIQESNMFIIDMPEFNIGEITRKIKEYKTKYGIEFVGFDYVALNNATVKEFISERGKSVGSRGDEILLNLVEELKQMAKKYDIGIITASQVNAAIKDFMKRDYEVLRGSKAMADKLTGGSIAMPITPQELKLIEPYIVKFNNIRTKEHIAPDTVETVYKSRFGEFPKECKVFYQYNLGNMRHKEMFVTNKDFKPIKIDKTVTVNE